MSQVATCPHCGASFQLTPEYVAQYGGQQTQCGNCQKPFPIPHASAAPIAWVGAPAAPVLGYMGSTTALTTQGVWREGSQILAVNGAVLPERCVKCNGPADGPPSHKKFYWHSPFIYVAVISPLIYVILALCLRKSGTVGVYLCHRHRVRRRWFITIALLSIPAAILVGIAGSYTQNPEFFIFPALAVFFGGLITGAIGARMLMPARIDDRFLWLKVAGSEFLATLSPAR